MTSQVSESYYKEMQLEHLLELEKEKQRRYREDILPYIPKKKKKKNH